MKTSVARWLLVGVLASASLALAEGQLWSAVGARTSQHRGSALEVSAGWPDVSVGFLHGVAGSLDLGGRVSFAYGVEGLVRQVVPGFKLQARVKARLVDSGRLSLGLVFEPGPLFHFPPNSATRVGLALPLGLRVGIAASSALSLAVLLGVPLWVEFGPNGGLNVPVLTGLGLEYFLTSDAAVFARLQLGPTIRGSGAAELTLDGVLGAAFHF